MEISTGHRQRTMANDQLDEVLSCPKSSLTSSSSSSEKKASIRPLPDQALRCPRCDSTNTKFCYYNNYSLSQPRYFCKGCRRYWTKGGSLRNVPVGGGCRKNKRSSSSIPPPSSSSSSSVSASASTSTSSKKLLLSSTLQDSMLIPPLSFEPSDLTLAFSTMHHTHHDPFLLANPNPNGHATFQNQSFYYGFGGDDFRGMLSFDATADAARAVVPNADPATNVDSSSAALRDYCNSSWHGLINSSLL